MRTCFWLYSTSRVITDTMNAFYTCIKTFGGVISSIYWLLLHCISANELLMTDKGCSSTVALNYNVGQSDFQYHQGVACQKWGVSVHEVGSYGYGIKNNYTFFLNVYILHWLLAILICCLVEKQIKG